MEAMGRFSSYIVHVAAVFDNKFSDCFIPVPRQVFSKGITIGAAVVTRYVYNAYCMPM